MHIDTLDEMLDQQLLSLEDIRRSLANAYQEQTDIITLEHYNESWDREDPFSVSMEEPVHRTSAFTASSIVGDAIGKKVLNTLKDGAVGATKLAGKGVNKAAGKVGEGVSSLKDKAVEKGKEGLKRSPGILLKLAKDALEKISTILGRIGALTSKILATGYPFMGMLIKRASELKDRAKSGEVTGESHVAVKGASDYLTIGDGYLEPNALMHSLKYLSDVQETMLSEHKLKQFDEFSDRIFGTYELATKRGKADQMIFVLAVLGLLTNPGHAVGAVFKKILEKTNPGIGQKIEHGATAAGGVYQGIGVLLLSLGKTGVVYSKQMGMGKLSLSTIPKFAPLYPFCKNTMRQSSHDMYVESTSDVLPGGYMFILRDYQDVLCADQTGSISRVGVSFGAGKGQKPKDNNVKTLSRDQIIHICDVVIPMMQNAQSYCKRWDQFYKQYEKQLEKITHIVMTYDSERTEDSVVTDYIRYSYRSAMNVVLGSLWNNCFGSDNQFIRYHLKLCRCLLNYCEASLAKDEPTDQ